MHQVPVVHPARFHARLRSVYKQRFLWASVAIVLILGAFAGDVFVQTWAETHTPPAVASLAKVISRYSDWPVLIPFLLAIAAFLRFTGHKRRGRLVLAMALAAMISGGAGTAIRSVVGRTRPSSHEVQGFYGVWHNSRLLIGRHEFNSFPSGHTATAAGVVGALLFLGRRAGLAGWIFTGAVGWSRIALNSHHFSDVIAALPLGVIGGWITWRHIMPFVESRFRRSKSQQPISPEMAPALPVREGMV